MAGDRLSLWLPKDREDRGRVQLDEQQLTSNCLRRRCLIPRISDIYCSEIDLHLHIKFGYSELSYQWTIDCRSEEEDWITELLSNSRSAFLGFYLFSSIKLIWNVDLDANDDFGREMLFIDPLCRWMGHFSLFLGGVKLKNVVYLCHKINQNISNDRSNWAMRFQTVVKIKIFLISKIAFKFMIIYSFKIHNYLLINNPKSSSLKQFLRVSIKIYVSRCGLRTSDNLCHLVRNFILSANLVSNLMLVVPLLGLRMVGSQTIIRV